MRTQLFVVFLFVIVFVVLSAAAFARPVQPQPQVAPLVTQKPVADPCPTSVTPDDKKACWTELARRAKFFLDSDPCESNSQQSDQERDNCKTDRAKQAAVLLNAYYRSLQYALHADLSKGKAARWNDSGLLTELRDTQAAWARYRDSQCEAETTRYAGGTVTISIKAGCEREKSEARLKELQDTFGYISRN